MPSTVWVQTVLLVGDGAAGLLSVGNGRPDGAGGLLDAVGCGWAGAELVGAGWPVPPADPGPAQPPLSEPLPDVPVPDVPAPEVPVPDEAVPDELAPEDFTPAARPPEDAVAGLKLAPAGWPGFTGGNQEVSTGGSAPLVTPRIGASRDVPVA
jgi:hypothetical protein